MEIKNLQNMTLVITYSNNILTNKMRYNVGLYNSHGYKPKKYTEDKYSIFERYRLEDGVFRNGGFNNNTRSVASDVIAIFPDIVYASDMSKINLTPVYQWFDEHKPEVINWEYVV